MDAALRAVHTTMVMMSFDDKHIAGGFLQGQTSKGVSKSHG